MINIYFAIIQNYNFYLKISGIYKYNKLIKMLSIEQLSTIINVSEKLLTVKELLNNMNYPMNELYIDKFWNNIENDKWIYIDSDMLLWVGYNCQDNYDNKKNILNY